MGSDDRQIAVLYPYSGMQRANNAESTVGAAILGFIVTGAVGNTFEVEYVQHVEYIGRNTNSFQTPSHADAQGFSNVTAAAGATYGVRGGTSYVSQAKAMFASLSNVLWENRETIIPIAESYLRGGVPNRRAIMNDL